MRSLSWLLRNPPNLVITIRSHTSKFVIYLAFCADIMECTGGASCRTAVASLCCDEPKAVGMVRKWLLSALIFIVFPLHGLGSDDLRVTFLESIAPESLQEREGVLLLVLLDDSSRILS